MVEISEGQVMIVGVKKRRNSKDIYGLGKTVFRTITERIFTSQINPSTNRESHSDITCVELFERFDGRVPWGWPYVTTKTYLVVDICDSEEPASCAADKYATCQYRFRCFTANNKGLDK